MLGCVHCHRVLNAHTVDVEHTHTQPASLMLLTPPDDGTPAAFCLHAPCWSYTVMNKLCFPLHHPHRRMCHHTDRIHDTLVPFGVDLIQWMLSVNVMGRFKDTDTQDHQWCHRDYQATAHTDLTELHTSHTLPWMWHILAAAWKRSEGLKWKKSRIGSHSKIWGLC